MAEVEVGVAQMHGARVENKQQIFSEMVFEHETEVAAERARSFMLASMRLRINLAAAAGSLTLYVVVEFCCAIFQSNINYCSEAEKRKTHIEREKLSQSSTKCVVRVLSNSRSIDMEMSTALVVVGHERRM